MNYLQKFLELENKNIELEKENIRKRELVEEFFREVLKDFYGYDYKKSRYLFGFIKCKTKFKINTPKFTVSEYSHHGHRDVVIDVRFSETDNSIIVMKYSLVTTLDNIEHELEPQILDMYKAQSKYLKINEGK